MNNYYLFVCIPQATELMLQKNNAKVSTYAPFRFQPAKGPRGPLLKIVTESTETRPAMDVLVNEV